MSDKNLNDFFDEELKKQEEKVERQNNFNNQNDDPFGFGGYNEQKHEQMYRVVPEYNGQQKFVNKKSKGKKGFIVAIVALAMVVVYFLGYFSFMLMNPDIKFISDVLNLINEYAYVLDESDDKYAHNYAYQAANAMLTSIDQYSRLLTPEEFYELMYPQELTTIANGLGYSFNNNGELYIAEVEVGSPAYNAGLFMGDVVLELDISGNVDGVADGKYVITSATKTEDIVKYIHSQKITFTIKRDNVVLQQTFTVEQTIYTGSAVEYYFGAGYTNMSQAYEQRLLSAGTLPNDVGYIRLTSFMDPYTMDGEQGLGDFTKAMNLFKQAGKKKLIFDLTYNTGGRDDISSAVASFLVHDKNKTDGKGVVVSIDRDKDDNVVDKTTTNSVYQNYFDVNAQQPQIVVLTNDRSASASELLTGALLDYQTAVQVGTTTYGKGIGQAVVQIKPAQANVGGKIVDSYWAAYMTYIKFYTPVSNKCMHGIGFEPQAQNVAENFDSQIDRAIEILSQKNA
ncbi:MAG: hypothetical protein E7344_02835 [Clostridiales bacterium]|nr:hypothetical protein [Clostridiales bacterium]